jgi:hypothetical protein
MTIYIPKEQIFSLFIAVVIAVVLIAVLAKQLIKKSNNHNKK